MKRKLLVSLMILILSTSLVPTIFAWELDRPKSYVEFIAEKEHTSETDGNASVGLGVQVYNYHENEQGPPSDGKDYVKLWVDATANTREALTYELLPPEYVRYDWHEVANPLPSWVGDLDDGYSCISVSAFPSQKSIRFYGGRKSAEYRNIWVSANGFISFEDLSEISPEDTRYYLESIPCQQELNTFIAPFWRDLDLNTAGSITYGEVYHSDPMRSCYVISWNNVPNKINGVQQSFQVVIEPAPDFSEVYRQSKIYFQYKQISLDDQTTVGIEDQHGLKGASYNYQSLSNQCALKLTQSSYSTFAWYLTIEVNKHGDPEALINIDEDPDSIRGYNVNLKYPEQYHPDPFARFATALAGTATLLITAWHPAGWIAVVGLIADTTLVGLSWVDWFATMHQPAQPMEVVDEGTPNNPDPKPLSYAKVQALDVAANDGRSVVDASFGVCVHWILTDSNNLNHDLSVTAKLEYAQFDSMGQLKYLGNVSTSMPVNLRMVTDICNDFSDPKQVTAGKYQGCLDTVDYADMYVIKNVNYGQVVEVEMVSPSDADYDLYLYDPNQIQKECQSNNGNATESISCVTDSTGDWYIKVQLKYWEGHKNAGLYTLTVDEPYPAPRVTLLTKTTAGADIDNVWVMIGFYKWYKSQVINMPVLPEFYLIDVEPSFVRGHYNYTFHHWNDGETSHSRGETISSNITLTAYYEQQFFNTPPNIPSKPSGPTTGYVGLYYTYSTGTNDSQSDDIYYKFYWGDGSTNTIGPYTSGLNVSASHYWSSPGTHNVKVQAKDSYESWSGNSSNLQVTISLNGGGGDGCPMLFVWNGTNYSYEGLLNIHNTEGTDMLTNHTLLATPQRVGYTYLFNLIEHPYTHSHIDQVKLYAVLENGMVIQLPLVWAWHSEYGNVLPQLFFSDDWRTETIGAIHNNGTSQTITLRFLALPSYIKVTAYIFQIEGYNPEFKP